MSDNDKIGTSPPDNGEETFRSLMEQSGICRDDGAPAHAPTPRVAPARKSRAVGGAPPTAGDTADEFMRPGLQHKEIRRLKQGKFRIGNDERIDLHGLTRDEAHQALNEFLDHCLIKGARYALVICGKGIHSPTGKPVIRSSIRNWLVQHNKVLAYCPAQLRDGGSGALYVLLKTGRPKN